MTENAKREEFTSSKIVTVPNLQSELKKKQQAPLDIYLENCEYFSRENLHREQISIDEYDITYQNIEDKIFAEYNYYPDLNSQIVSESQDKINSKFIEKKYQQDFFNQILYQSKAAGQNNNLKKHKSFSSHLEQYQSLDIRIYKKLIMVNGKQHMIVKTWEKLQHVKYKIQFHIKTLRIYDIQMKVIFKTMTEQVDGEFNSENFYDISILQFHEKIFYFKRIQHYQGPLQECENVDQSIRSDVSFESHSYLQLFQFDFLNNKESELEQYQIIEESQEDKQSFNIIFSQEFGNSSQNFQQYSDEIEFLNDQYFLAQKYIEGNEMKSFAIFQMDDFDNPIHHECHKKDNSCMTTKEILYVFHKKEVQNENITVKFVMISQDQHLHMSYNLDINQLICDIQIFSSGQLTKESQIHVQQENFELIDQINKDNQLKLFTVKQNYYIDQNNQVQLLYPNYRAKSQQFEAIEQIKNRLKIKSVNLNMYKIIYVNNFHYHKNEQEHCNNLNVAQEISHLKKILNLKYINKNQLFIFCEDEHDQVLYITEPEVNTITVIQMKNHHTVESQISQLVEKKMDRSFMNKPSLFEIVQQINNKSMKQLTRQQSNQNQIKAKMYLLFFLFVTEDFQEQEKMTIDVNSQQIQFLTSKKKNEYKENLFVKMNLDLNQKQLKKLMNKIMQYNKNENLFLFSDNQGKLHAFQLYNPHAFQQYNLIKNKLSQVFKSINSLKLKKPHQQDFEIEKIQIEQITKCKNIYSIALSVQCLVNGAQKSCYFFIKKSINQIQELIKDSIHADKSLKQRSKFLLQHNQQIQIINNKCELEITIFTDLQKILESDQYSNIRLDFENIYDYNEDFNFAVFIFQVNHKTYLKINSDQKSQANQDTSQIKNENFICIYDIQQKKIVQRQPIAIQKKKEKFLYKNNQEFNNFRIIRSSDCLKDNKEQFKYQIFTFYNEKLGRIKVQQFQISRFEKIAEKEQQKTVIEYSIKLIGVKEILMSHECIQKIDWSYFMKSQLIPFIDEELKTQGCQLLMKLSSKHCAFINLLDNYKNNLCSYRSDIAEFGYKRFELAQDDSDVYLMVVTVNILDSVIDDNLFEEHEVELILKQMTENILQMRRIDFEYLLLNTFDSLIEKDFFVSQEILNGKSICDICLSTPKILKDGLQFFKELSEDRYREKSLASQIVSYDIIRETYFKESGIWPRERIITLDYNLNSTFYRAICQGANISLQILIEYIFSLYNCYEYCEIIMLDLPLILDKDCKPIFEFFNITDHELISQSKCSIEYYVGSEKIDQFSSFQKRSFTINNITNEIYFQDQIIDQIYERDQLNKSKLNDKISTKFSVQNSYIDFKWMFLGQKIKNIKQKESIGNLKFDHEYFSVLILKQQDYLQFYGLPSVQKIIDFQYTESQIYMKGLFYFYMIFFICPFILSMLTIDKEFKIKLMAFQQISQILLLFIEIIQMYENKWDYFDGWNMIDLFQIILFQTYFVVEIEEIKTGIKQPYDPFIKMILIVTSFMKSLHFVTVFEEFGFFTKMLEICIIDLIPFICSFVSMGLFYAILMAVLQVEIDDEIIGGKDGLGYFGLLYLSVWRNGLSKLGQYKYTYLFKPSDDIHDKLFTNITLSLIWILYFIQIISQYVVSLNLMIGMIQSTYSKTMKLKYMYMYRNKAELNQECFQLLKYLKSLDYFRVIIFSSKILDLKSDAVTMHKSEQEFFDLMDEVQSQIQLNNDCYKLKECYSHIDKLKMDQNYLIKKFDKEYHRYHDDIISFKNEFTVQFNELILNLKMAKKI